MNKIEEHESEKKDPKRNIPKQLRFWKIFLLKLFGITTSKQFFFKKLLTFGIL